jgi:glycosyltransferase involved in cell wall biosynthesis
MIKILFFIRSLNAGGAERQLVVTAKGLIGRGYQVTVLTFYSGGFYASELENSDVQLLSLNKQGRWDLLALSFRLCKVLRKQAPDVIYSFMGVSNSLAVLLRPFIPTTKIVWGVRASNMDLDKYDWLSRWSYRLECYLSRFANTIIANSHAGLDYAVEHGFPLKKMCVIANGIDTERFYPNALLGKPLREKWGVSNNQFLIGVVGRIDPMKGIPTFLDAVAMIKQHYPPLRFVWVGVGDVDYEKKKDDL